MYFRTEKIRWLFGLNPFTTDGCEMRLRGRCTLLPKELPDNVLTVKVGPIVWEKQLCECQYKIHTRTATFFLKGL